MSSLHKSNIFYPMDIFKQMMGLYPELTIEDIKINQEFKGFDQTPKEGIVVTVSKESPHPYYPQTQPYQQGGPILWGIVEHEEYLNNVKPFLKSIAQLHQITIEELLEKWFDVKIVRDKE